MSNKINCPLCEKFDDIDIIRWHLSSTHKISGIKANKIVKKIEHELLTERRNSLTICRVCNSQVLNKNIKRHLKKIHEIKDENTQKPLSRRQRVNKLFYPDEFTKGNDLFDSGVVVSGGGVGVGKGKKK